MPCPCRESCMSIEVMTTGSKESCRLWARPLQALGPKGPLPTNRMSELFTYGSVGGRRAQARPLPGSRPRSAAAELVVKPPTRLMQFLKNILSQHACFTCRKVFKRPEEHRPFDKRGIRPPRSIRKCPECGEQMIYMGPKFRAPPITDTDEWNRIERALEAGLDYGIPTVRKQKAKPQISPQLRIALGVYGKRRPKKAV